MADGYNSHNKYFSILRKEIALRWYSILVGQTIIILSVVTVPNLLLQGRPRLNADETLFAYSGWLWAETAKVPYLHLWDVKPPAIHETAALFSLLSGGSPWGIVILSILFMCLFTIGSILLIGKIVYYHTLNPIAAYISATTLLAYRVYYNLAATGLRPKHFTLFFGLLGIYLYLVEERWMSGSFSAALAAGYWQFGVIFPVLAVSTTHISKNKIKAVVSGGMAATLLVVVPVYLSSAAAFSSMLVEVIGTAVWVTEPLEFGIRLEKFLNFLGIALPLIGLGLFGTVLAVLNRKTIWITGGTIWFLLQVFRFDLDAGPDLIPLVAFAALGMGIFIELINEEITPLYLTLGVVFTGLIISLFTLATPVSWDFAPGSLDALFWNQQVSERCHIRMSGTEQRFVEIVGGNVNSEECRYQIWQLLRK